jgi:DNA polymerase III epsilon subunit-like protein
MIATQILISLHRTTLALAAAYILAGPAAAQPAWPAEAPQEWGLAIIDVETTGLDPAHHEMIDIGIIYADLEGNEIGRFFTRIMPPHPERIDEAARAVNGFSEERWRELEALDEADAVAQFLAFHESAAADRRFIFTAYNAQFDRGFIDALLNRHGSDFDALYTYFLLDIPSMAWGAGIPNLDNAQVAEALGVPDETRDPMQHTGATGAEWNLSLYRALLGRVSN